MRQQKQELIVVAVVLFFVAVITVISALTLRGKPGIAPEGPVGTDEAVVPPPGTDPKPETTAPAPETTGVPETEPQTTAPPETTPAFTEVTGGGAIDVPPAVTDSEQLPPPSTTDFSGALFIGDSRTVGLHDYAKLPGADVFATTGMNVFRLFSDRINVSGVGDVTLEELLAAKQYGKIYIMLGINEIGYDLDRVLSQYGKALDKIQAAQPEAILYIEANLMIRKDRSERDSVYNNKNMRYLNDGMAAFADGKRRIYVDVNPLFDDGEGNLAAEYTCDEFHLIGVYYTNWASWLYEKTK